MGGEGRDNREEATMSDTPHRPTLCVDFDGVIHSYTSGWKGASIIPDPPVPGALQWLLDASKLFSLVVYSSRSKDPEAIAAMRMWITFHARQELPESKAEAFLNAAITFAHEKPAAFLTIDDRAICFEGDWSKLDPTKLLAFKPWHQKQGRVISRRWPTTSRRKVLHNETPRDPATFALVRRSALGAFRCADAAGAIPVNELHDFSLTEGPDGRPLAHRIDCPVVDKHRKAGRMICTLYGCEETLRGGVALCPTCHPRPSTVKS